MRTRAFKKFRKKKGRKRLAFVFGSLLLSGSLLSCATGSSNVKKNKENTSVAEAYARFSEADAEYDAKVDALNRKVQEYEEHDRRERKAREEARQAREEARRALDRAKKDCQDAKKILDELKYWCDEGYKDHCAAYIKGKKMYDKSCKQLAYKLDLSE